MLGDPPPAPDDVWHRALDHALDPWVTPDPSLVPDDDASPLAFGGQPGLDDDVVAPHLTPDAPRPEPDDPWPGHLADRPDDDDPDDPDPDAPGAP